MASPKAKTNLEKMGFSDPDRKNPTHDDLQIRILENPENLIRSISNISNLKSLEIEEVTLEKPVVSGNFIVGYIDCVIIFTYTVNDKKRYGNLAIEIKTKIEGFGDVLRQINTYKKYRDDYKNFPLSNCVFVIASEDDRYKKQFESQGIRFYDFK